MNEAIQIQAKLRLFLELKKDEKQISIDNNFLFNILDFIASFSIKKAGTKFTTMILNSIDNLFRACGCNLRNDKNWNDFFLRNKMASPCFSIRYLVKDKWKNSTHIEYASYKGIRLQLFLMLTGRIDEYDGETTINLKYVKFATDLIDLVYKLGQISKLNSPYIDARSAIEQLKFEKIKKVLVLFKYGSSFIVALEKENRIQQCEDLFKAISSTKYLFEISLRKFLEADLNFLSENILILSNIFDKHPEENEDWNECFTPYEDAFDRDPPVLHLYELFENKEAKRCASISPFDSSNIMREYYMDPKALKKSIKQFRDTVNGEKHIAKFSAILAKTIADRSSSYLHIVSMLQAALKSKEKIPLSGWIGIPYLPECYLEKNFPHLELFYGFKEHYKSKMDANMWLMDYINQLLDVSFV